ncbi:uncharacterized protein LOC120083990 [Benincasa hispida]|uniref:uncharacterized protein LOC120083990 n=1 Tax=Benincasa hispida TaxID=102211 RepID=UPI001900AE4A|nr:uncharacterized protein LOC120083990 [Benincasa hispida]
MDFEQILNLFDLFWFESKIFNKHPFSSKEIAGAESRRRLRGRRMRGWESRSLLELELEELKGFMDLGFVFSEEDKGSSLASIVPGLNRIGKREEEEEERKFCSEISRPYLSEAWKAMEEEEDEEELKKSLMMKWKFPSNQMHMKVHLKWWAHVVASTVR